MEMKLRMRERVEYVTMFAENFKEVDITLKGNAEIVGEIYDYLRQFKPKNIDKDNVWEII